MKTAIPTVTKNRCLADAFHLLQEKSAPAVAIVDGLRRLVGLVTPETVGEMLMLHRTLPKGAVRALGADDRAERRHARALKSNDRQSAYRLSGTDPAPANI